MQLTEKEHQLLESMRKVAESRENRNGVEWANVYLDNVPLAQSNPRQFSALTGSLTKKGYYEPQEDAWGLVRLSEK